MKSVISTREEILDFLSINLDLRCSSRYNYRTGDGNGTFGGEGYGHGDHVGCGYMAGGGDGDGYGSGYGYSYGEGYGSGPGTDDGNGFGDREDGRDIKALNGNVVDYVDFLPTIITQVRGNTACGYIINDDLTLTPCYIAKVGNSFAHGDTLKEAVAYAEEKEMENMPVDERIKKFVETFGSIDSEHTGKEFYVWHHILTGSCRMGRDEFCKAHNVDLTKKYTVKYFLNLTKKSYGGNIIKLIEEKYENIED